MPPLLAKQHRAVAVVEIARGRAPRDHCIDQHVERRREDISVRAVDAAEVGTRQGVPGNQILNLVPIRRPGGPEEVVYVCALAGRRRVVKVDLQRSPAVAKKVIMESQRRERVRETGKRIRQKVAGPADEGKCPG
jgi:hypothetical protein